MKECGVVSTLIDLLRSEVKDEQYGKNLSDFTRIAEGVVGITGPKWIYPNKI
jgi:hypothetical protein